MTTHVKVNTQSEQVEAYLISEEGFTDSLFVYPDTFNVQITGNDNYIKVANNSFVPANNSTSATLSIPVYLGTVLGVQFIPLSIEMSSTTVTLSKHNASANYNNRANWEIYKRFGWNASNTDGYPNSEAGMAVQLEYLYEGNVSSATTVYINVKSSIRYEYVYYLAGSTMTLHLTTGEMACTTPLTIVP